MNHDDVYGIMPLTVANPETTAPDCLTLLLVSDSANSVGYKHLTLILKLPFTELLSQGCVADYDNYLEQHNYEIMGNKHARLPR